MRKDLDHALHMGCASRRHFLASGAMGMGSLALAWLLQQNHAAGEPIQPLLERPSYDTRPRPAHRSPQAKAMISLFMQGGPSHVDLFDPKPELTRLDGQTFPGDIQYDNAAQASSKVLGCPWKFQKHGQAGIEVSELLPHFASIVDQVTLIRSMHTGVNNHGQSILALNAGKAQEGRPSLGSWITYALGCESQELPAYVVLTDPAGLPVYGARNWSNEWLPSVFQGTVVRPREPRILNLEAPRELRGAAQARYLDFLEKLNRRDLERHPGESDLEARIASYELAARMQTSAKEALDISGETAATLRLYGIDEPATREYGTRCLMARRLVERGVRFVHVFTRYQFWDHHGAIRTALPASCLYTDQGAAALVTDLRQRGLLDSTLVHWGGEMGRLPVIQNDAGPDQVGRDHNTHGFSAWLAGGGVRAGLAHGETDEFGHHAVRDVVHHTDYLATLMHLFGLEEPRVTYRRNNQEQTLVDGQPCRIVREILEHPELLDSPRAQPQPAGPRTTAT